jgi:hypothetical protein
MGVLCFFLLPTTLKPLHSPEAHRDSAIGQKAKNPAKTITTTSNQPINGSADIPSFLAKKID